MIDGAVAAFSSLYMHGGHLPRSSTHFHPGIKGGKGGNRTYDLYLKCITTPSARYPLSVLQNTSPSTKTSSYHPTSPVLLEKD